MTSKKKAEENRAWFLHDDNKFSMRVYVMYDQKNNGKFNDYTDFKMGWKVEKLPTEPLIFNVERTAKATLEYLLSWDFLPNSTNILLANKKALEVLEEVAHCEFQALPTKIVMYDATVINDYHLINVLVDGKFLNEEKSIMLPEEEREVWQEYKKCYYDKNCLGDKNLVINDPGVFNIGSEKLRQAVMREKLRGLVFQEDRAGQDYFLD